jgi:hypothetical protein
MAIFVSKYAKKLASTTAQFISKMLPKVKTQVIGPGLLKFATNIQDIQGLFNVELQASLNNGNSTILREQLEDIHQISRGSLQGIEVQAHHVIPKTFKDHELLKRIDFNIDHAANGIPLQNDFHFGSHNNYNEAIRRILKKIDLSGKDKNSCQQLIIETIGNANEKILEGCSLRRTLDSISIDEWYNAILPSSLR